MVPVVTINMQTGEVVGVPDIITRGFVLDDLTDELMKDAGALIRNALEGAPVEERTDVGLLRERIRAELQRVLRRKAGGRRPLVVPVVMEM